MTTTGGRSARLLTWADSFLPEGPRDAELVRRVRVSVAQAVLGVVFIVAMVALLAAMGSPASAAAISVVGFGLVGVPWWIRRGASVLVLAHAMVALTYGAILVVAIRSGGFASPAVAWNFLLPLSVYAVCGRRSALGWSLLAGAQIVGLYVVSLVGITLPEDLRPPGLAALRVIAYAGVLGAIIALLLVLDGARRASIRAQREAERALERQRMLDDMHDGVGSHLLGLLVQSRAGTLQEGELTASLETALDDLRLIVDSLDPVHASLDAALGALRARLSARCEGLGIELEWDVAPDVDSVFEPAEGMHVLRAIQEMVTNALRHAETRRIDLRLGPVAPGSGSDARFELAVRDYGVGLCAGRNDRGRGMKSLRLRARKLGGTLVLEPRVPGVRVAIELLR